jgi:cyclase
LTQQDIEGTVLYPPTITFYNSMKVDLGGVVVDLAFPGASHTDGSITVAVPQDNVLFLGDILFTKYHPYIAEGDIPSWIRVLDNLEHTKAKIIVPGHGPLSTVADIRDMKLYLQVFSTEAFKLCKGKQPQDAPAITKELLKVLPDQGRTELPFMVESNLREKYLPSGILHTEKKK